MRNSTLRITLVILAIIAFVGAAGHWPAAAAYTATIATTDLSTGMKGYGLTVFKGVKPEPFDVEILAVSPRGDSPGSMILVRASGKNIEAAGGVAEGMSGSPVYIDGKLIGAIAYVFPGSDHFIAGVTPIADMLRMLDYDDIGTDSVASTRAAGAPPLAAGATMYVSGASQRAIERLSEAVSFRGIRVLPASASLGTAARDAVASDYRLVPGAMVAMQLAEGDIEVSVYGSVTHVDEGRFLAFGHPVLSLGAVDLQAAGATVHTVVRSDSVPFKVASSLENIGAFTQDRLYGSAGKAGARAHMIPVIVEAVHDAGGKPVRVQSAVSGSELLVADLFFTVALGGADQAIDRLGQGTASIDYVIELEGHEPLRRSDTVWSASDISYAVAEVPRRALELVVGNAVEQAVVKSLSMNVTVSAGRRTARILSAIPLEPVVAPGGVARIEVTLRPFRGPLTTRIVEVEIPDDTPEGPVAFMVTGGGVGDDDEGESYEPDEDALAYMDLDELLAELGRAPRGDEIVVQMEDYFYDYDEPYLDGEDYPHTDLLSGVAVSTSQSNPDARDKAGDSEEDGDADHGLHGTELPSARLLTEWFIEGTTWVDMEISATD